MGIQTALRKVLYQTERFLNCNSSTILTVVGAVGVVATAVLATKATTKAVRLVDSATEEKGEELTPVEVVKVAAPLYIPTVAIGATSLVCIFGANALNKKQQASLISAYTMLDQTFKQYRKAANNVYGEDADEKITAEVAKQTYISADGYYVYDSRLDETEDKHLFYDWYSQRYFESTMSSVLNAQYHTNRMFILRGYVSLNEFYEYLGLEKVSYGDDVGWGWDLIEDGVAWIDFDNRYTKLEDNMDCYIITPIWSPTGDYLAC